jgi:glucose-6-phosphate 1-dehydrogenase
LIIRVFPDEGFVLKVNAKVPGKSNDITQVALDFCHSCVFGPDTTLGYEQIFKDILAGEQAIAVRFDEIESAWKIIDALERLSLPLYRYQQGSTGPQELTAFAHKHGMEWQS